MFRSTMLPDKYCYPLDLERQGCITCDPFMHYITRYRIILFVVFFFAIPQGSGYWRWALTMSDATETETEIHEKKKKRTIRTNNIDTRTERKFSFTLHEPKPSCVSRIEFIRSKYVNFSAHLSGRRRQSRQSAAASAALKCRDAIVLSDSAAVGTLK